MHEDDPELATLRTVRKSQQLAKTHFSMVYITEKLYNYIKIKHTLLEIHSNSPMDSTHKLIGKFY